MLCYPTPTPSPRPHARLPRRPLRRASSATHPRAPPRRHRRARPPPTSTTPRSCPAPGPPHPAPPLIFSRWGAAAQAGPQQPTQNTQPTAASSAAGRRPPFRAAVTHQVVQAGRTAQGKQTLQQGRGWGGGGVGGYLVRDEQGGPAAHHTPRALRCSASVQGVQVSPGAHKSGTMPSYMNIRYIEQASLQYNHVVACWAALLRPTLHSLSLPRTHQTPIGT